jgi:TPR repeat protein
MAGWLQHGCDLAHGTAPGNVACRGLGQLLEAGAIRSRGQTALGLYGRACDEGHGASCASAAALLRGKAARARLDRGCTLDHGPACLTLAALLERSDPAKAQALRQHACAIGLRDACR